MNIAMLANAAQLMTGALRYLIIILMVIYALQSYTVFRVRYHQDKQALFLRQNVSMFIIHFIAFLTMFLDQKNPEILYFYAVQVVYLLVTILLMRLLYRRSSRLLINHMCMLIMIGFVMITRLSYDSAVKQFKIVALGTAVSLLIPAIVRRVLALTKLTWAYTFVGIGLLGLVFVAAQTTYGAKLSLSIGGFSLQPSEFVKIIFVFGVAGLLSEAHNDLRRIILATALAAGHVLILVISTDLGSALIFFITYLAMLFAATRNPYLSLLGILAGALAAVAAYFLFYHVRVRVQIWQDPFSDYSGNGYQICQSLFSIAAGGWFGTGLGKGSPTSIPFVQQDMMFSAICEEMGAIFAICLLLVCMSCFIMIVNVAMKLTNRFYRLVALGLGVTYAVQIFLTVGGGMKMIPLTGVTLPFVSYGGSSALSTLIMFAIIQGLYMMRSDEQMHDEEQRRERYETAGDRGRMPNGSAGGERRAAYPPSGNDRYRNSQDNYHGERAGYYERAERTDSGREYAKYRAEAPGKDRRGGREQ